MQIQDSYDLGHSLDKLIQELHPGTALYYLRLGGGGGGATPILITWMCGGRFQ